MLRFIAVLAAVAVMSLSLACISVAQARTRTPTPTATWTSVPSAPPSPTPTPTIPPDQIAAFEGQVWVDGRISNAPVSAKIDDVDCGQPRPLAIVCDPDSCGPMWSLNVVSAQVKPGCGHEGATIQFYVGDRPAQAAVWRGGSWQGKALIVGAPFAMIFGNFGWAGDLPHVHYIDSPEPDDVLVPYVGNAACGYTLVLRKAPWLYAAAYEYWVVVFSHEQQAGCGYEGAPVTLKLANEQGKVVATSEQSAIWHAYDGGDDSSQRLNLTFITTSGIRIGNTGTGGSRSSGPPLDALLALGVVGVLTVAAGVALRRRTA